MKKGFIEDYFNKYKKLISTDKEFIDKLFNVHKNIIKISNYGNKIILIGNGGSAAMASHVSVDFSKNANIRAINFNEADLITCLSNDRGFENWAMEALKLYSDPNDLVILISSSGNSQNMINAAKYCLGNSLQLITFTGMDINNTLKTTNKDGFNFWVDSMAYNYIENIHQLWLLALVDMVIGDSIYSA